MEHSISKIIREIAQDLDCGNDCYFNPKTQEIIAIPSELEIFGEEELFAIELAKIETQKADLIKIEKPESYKSFKIMEHFVGQLPNCIFKLELNAILQRKKPFQHFKNAIDDSDFRQDWFTFKQNELEKIIEDQLHI